MSKLSQNKNIIAQNRKAWHDYFIEEEFEAGLVLKGWEVKSLRSGTVQLREGYVMEKNSELYLVGVHLSPLSTVSTYISLDPTRTRKLLLKKPQIHKLKIASEQQGYTIVPLALHWKAGYAKIRIGIAKGKKQHDKRASIRAREWDREKQRTLKNQLN
tara:strand:- start:5908 stop:6381 length:474 start_codon:yes stop_codon:yes gene_type:complete